MLCFIRLFFDFIQTHLIFSLVDFVRLPQYNVGMNLESYNLQTVWVSLLNHEKRLFTVEPGTLTFHDADKFFVMSKTWTLDPNTFNPIQLVDRSLGPFSLNEYLRDEQIHWWTAGRTKVVWTFRIYTNVEHIKRFLMRQRLLDYNISTNYTDLLGNLQQL